MPYFTTDVGFEESDGLNALLGAVDGGDVESVNGTTIEVKDIKEATEDQMRTIEDIRNGMSTMSTQLTGFKTILESVKGEVDSIKSGQLEAMDQMTSEIRIANAKRLVPQELKGLVAFKTFPTTGNLYALVKEKVNFQDAQV